MLVKLVLAFTVVPLVELGVLIKVGGYIGLFPTLGLVLLTGISGAFLARSQGFWVFNKMSSEINQGNFPGDILFDSVFILVGGLLLLTPGFITDTSGLLLLIPFTRGLIKIWVKREIERAIERNRVKVHPKDIDI